MHQNSSGFMHIHVSRRVFLVRYLWLRLKSGSGERPPRYFSASASDGRNEASEKCMWHAVVMCRMVKLSDKGCDWVTTSSEPD